LSAAFIQQPILTLMLRAYGIGDPTPDHPEPLSAPQSVLMAAVARGVFDGNLPWEFVCAGMAIAAVVIMVDAALVHFDVGFRIPALPLAMGIYLPFGIQTSMVLGGIVAWFAHRHNQAAPQNPSIYVDPRAEEVDEEEAKFDEESLKERNQEGMLFAGGLITGESLMGLFMAIPIVVASDAQVLSLASDPPMWPGTLLLILFMVWLYAASTKQRLLAVLATLCTCRPCRQRHQ